MAEDFDDFLKRREQVSGEYISGKSDTLLAISTKNDPASFFPPNGKTVKGAVAINTVNAEGAKSFAPGSKGRFEVWQSATDGELAFWTGLQHAEAMLAGKDQPVTMKLRVTEVFRREAGEWKLVHRHADEAEE